MMKGFKVNSDGDLIIDNDIEMTNDMDLIRQTIQTVLGTNKGEWFFNVDEGINFDNILTKKPDYDVIRNEIAQGVKQVDSYYELLEFNYHLDKNTRKLCIDFSVSNKKNQIVKSSFII